MRYIFSPKLYCYRLEALIFNDEILRFNVFEDLLPERRRFFSAQGIEAAVSRFSLAI